MHVEPGVLLAEAWPLAFGARGAYAAARRRPAVLTQCVRAARSGAWWRSQPFTEMMPASTGPESPYCAPVMTKSRPRFCGLPGPSSGMVNRLYPAGIGDDSRVHFEGSPRSRLMKKSASSLSVTTIVPFGPPESVHDTTGAAFGA